MLQTLKQLQAKVTTDPKHLLWASSAHIQVQQLNQQQCICFALVYHDDWWYQRCARTLLSVAQRSKKILGASCTAKTVWNQSAFGSNSKPLGAGVMLSIKQPLRRSGSYRITTVAGF